MNSLIRLLAAMGLMALLAGCNFFAQDTEAAQEAEETEQSAEPAQNAAPNISLDAGNEPPNPDIWPPGPAPDQEAAGSPGATPTATEADVGDPEPEPDVWPPGPLPPEGQPEGASE